MRELLARLERWETELFLIGLAGWILPALFEPLAILAPLRLALVLVAILWLARVSGWREEAGTSRTVRLVASQLASLLSPPVWLFSLRQIVGEIRSRVRSRFRPPTPDTWSFAGPIRLPVTGCWMVYNGGPTPETSHSWSLWGQRYAYDLVVTDHAGRTAPAGARRPEEHYAWNRPIVAPADGIVVAVRDGHRDCPWIGVIDPLAWSPLGNFVVIQHEPGVYSLAAHLRRGSVCVRPGQRVQAGDLIGHCGNSGHSTEPHLHWQLLDRPDVTQAISLPVRFTRYWRQREGIREPVEAGTPVRGERICAEPDAPCEPSSEQAEGSADSPAPAPA